MLVSLAGERDKTKEPRVLQYVYGCRFMISNYSRPRCCDEFLIFLLVMTVQVDNA